MSIPASFIQVVVFTLNMNQIFVAVITYRVNASLFGQVEHIQLKLKMYVNCGSLQSVAR